jgi:hypothetical protein
MNGSVITKIRQILRKISFFNLLTPKEEIDNLARLGLTSEEWKTLKGNCAPWACR